MERFLEYLSRVDPQWITEFRGADPARISLFEDLVGRPLPKSYRSFLELMGKDDAGLNLLDEGTTNIDALIEFYREELLNPTEVYHPLTAFLDNIIVIAFNGFDPESLGLRCSVLGEPGVVVPIGEGGVTRPHAESLEKFLCQAAFRELAGRGSGTYGKHVALCMKSPGCPAFEYIEHVMPQARNVAAELGIIELDFSDEFTFCGEMDGVAVSILQRTHDVSGLRVMVQASKKSRCKEIISVFARRFRLHNKYSMS